MEINCIIQNKLKMDLFYDYKATTHTIEFEHSKVTNRKGTKVQITGLRRAEFSRRFKTPSTKFWLDLAKPLILSTTKATGSISVEPNRGKRLKSGSRKELIHSNKNNRIEASVIRGINRCV